MNEKGWVAGTGTFNGALHAYIVKPKRGSTIAQAVEQLAPGLDRESTDFGSGQIIDAEVKSPLFCPLHGSSLGPICFKTGRLAHCEARPWAGSIRQLFVEPAIDQKP